MTEIWRAALAAPPRVGGKEVHVVELSRVQARTARVTVFFAWGHPGPEPFRWVRLRTPPLGTPATLHATAFALRLAWKVLWAAARGRGPDLLHVHGEVYEAAVMSLLGRLLPGLPILFTVHGMPRAGRFPALVWRIARPTNVRFIAVSSAVAGALRASLGPAGHIVVQSSGVRAAFFDTAFTGHPRHLLSLGHLSSRRDFAAVLHAAAASNSRPPVIFLGDGPDAQALCSLAQDLAVKLTVRRLDEAEEIAEVLAAGVYVHPRSSIDEGFPTSVLEALTVGSPTLVPPFSGMGDYVQSTSNVRVYRSVAELSSLIDEVWTAPTPSTGVTPSWPAVADAVARAALSER